MKISIDTAHDSAEQIRKAIRLLQSLVEHDASQGSRNIFDSPSADLFGGTPAQSQPAPSESPVAAFGSLFSDDKPVTLPEEKKETGEIPHIELY
jgi:hypothetical protein